MSTTVTVRYFAAAAAASGTEEEAVSHTGNLGELLQVLGERHTEHTVDGRHLAEVLTRCSFLINGARSDQTALLSDGDVIDVMPPFAGG